MADVLTAEAGELELAGLRRDTRAGTTATLRQRRRKLLRWGLMGAGAAALTIGGGAFWLNGGRYVTTTDAYVQANVLNLATDVSGIVQDVPVHEGEHVVKGQVLYRLDPLPFRIAVDGAKANLSQTELTLNSLRANYASAERDVAARAAQVQADQATYDRYAQLVKTNAVTRQEYDNARFKLAADQASLGSSEAAGKAALAKLGGRADLPVTDMPAYKQAAAKLAEAERELNHTVVRAPFDGVVTRVSSLQPGQYLTASTPGFGLVGTNDLWVAAEPKEGVLTWARNGDAATITIDAYPGRVWHGTVQSIAPATDQEFSLLPAQNSSGNWVKVVQRVPVRVTLQAASDAPPLSAGMSAEVTIDTGHHRTLSDLL